MQVKIARDRAPEDNLWFVSDEREIQFRPFVDTRWGPHIISYDLTTFRDMSGNQQLPWKVITETMATVGTVDLPPDLIDFVVESCIAQREARQGVFRALESEDPAVALKEEIYKGRDRFAILGNTRDPNYFAYRAREAECAAKLYRVLASTAAGDCHRH